MEAHLILSKQMDMTKFKMMVSKMLIMRQVTMGKKN